MSDESHAPDRPDSTLHGVAENMREMFARHSQDAAQVLDLALDLLQNCGWESWAADGGTRQAQEFERWRGSRRHLEAYGDPECATRFPVFIQALALSHCLPNVTIGLARSALICMHGFFAQARASYRATVEECLYAYMLMQDPERCRQYLGDSKTLWRASGTLRKKWDKNSRRTDATVHASVPSFGLTYVRLHQEHIHSGSHAGFAQSSHRTAGMSQAFVDVNAPHLGGFSVAFASCVLQLVNDLGPLYPKVDVAAWRAGYAEFDRAKWPILNALQQGT